MAKTFGFVTPSYTALFDQGLKIDLYDFKVWFQQSNTS